LADHWCLLMFIRGLKLDRPAFNFKVRGLRKTVHTGPHNIFYEIQGLQIMA